VTSPASLTETVSQQSGVPAEQVDAVLTAYNTVLAGDPVGLIRCSPDGDVATRIDKDGGRAWSVVTRNGGFYYSQDDLAWPVVYQPPDTQTG
jgi:hypothetical protein